MNYLGQKIYVYPLLIYQQPSEILTLFYERILTKPCARNSTVRTMQTVNSLFNLISNSSQWWI